MYVKKIRILKNIMFLCIEKMFWSGDSFDYMYG